MGAMMEQDNNKLDKDLLHEFMRSFYGYGNPEARVWLVGMEEGAGHGFEEISSRLGVWAQNHRSFEDARDYHIAFGLPEYFAPKPKAGRTWTRLIRLVLAAKGAPQDRETILEIQRDRWGRMGGAVCLPELLPLPNPTTRHWGYGEWTGDTNLATRGKYRKVWLTPRIDALRRLVSKHRPRVVVFYGKSNAPYWERIVGRPLAPEPSLDMGRADDGVTSWFSIRHPGDYLPGDYFSQAGDLIGQAVGRSVFADFG